MEYVSYCVRITCHIHDLHGVIFGPFDTLTKAKEFLDLQATAFRKDIDRPIVNQRTLSDDEKIDAWEGTSTLLLWDRDEIEEVSPKTHMFYYQSFEDPQLYESETGSWYEFDGAVLGMVSE